MPPLPRLVTVTLSLQRLALPDTLMSTKESVMVLVGRTTIRHSQRVYGRYTFG